MIGQYSSWIEISLIVNERFVEFFSYALQHVDLRETACACLEEIVNKGMDIRPKLKLIDYLWDNLIRANALALEQQIALLNVYVSLSHTHSLSLVSKQASIVNRTNRTIVTIYSSSVNCSTRLATTCSRVGSRARNKKRRT